MPTSTQELQSFHEYAAARLQNGGAKLELDDLLNEWKCRNSAAKLSISGTCCAFEDEMTLSRDHIHLVAESKGC